MPSSYLDPSNYAAQTYGGGDSSVLLDRLNKNYGVSSNTGDNKEDVDMTPLAFKLRREERRRKLFRNVSFKSDDGKPVVALFLQPIVGTP